MPSVPSVIDMELLCRNLKILRVTNNLSQETLAEKIFITRSTYSTYETGTKIPDLQTLDALSSFYGISFESLIRHDLSQGILNEVYLGTDDKELRDVLNAYESLSVASKNIITEHLDTLLEREHVFFKEYGFSNGK